MSEKKRVSHANRGKPTMTRKQSEDGRVRIELVKDSEEQDIGYQRLPTSDHENDDEDGRGNRGSVAVVEASWGEQLLEGHYFQAAMAMLIVANALVIGLETDIPNWPHWDDIENLFLFLFTVELVLKIIIMGPCNIYHFEHADIHWNLFDLFIVSLGLFDFTMGLVGGSSTGGFATAFRIIRLLRILRIFRIIKFLKQLYLLAFGLVEATKAVFWVAILMCFVLYVCSIVLVKTIGRPPEADPHHTFLSLHFGSIVESMLTLFVLMSSPNLPVYQDETGLLEGRPGFCIFLVCFITFGSFGIIAMLTGVISESMFEKNELRKEEARAEHELARQQLGELARELFASLNVNDDGEAPVLEVLKLGKPMCSLLDASGAIVAHDDVLRLIENMDVDGGGQISGQEFVRTMEKIAEGLSPLSIQEVHHKLGSVELMISTLQQSVDALQLCTQDMGDVIVRMSERIEASNQSPGRPHQVDCSEVSQILETHAQQIKLHHKDTFSQVSQILERHASKISHKPMLDGLAELVKKHDAHMELQRANMELQQQFSKHFQGLAASHDRISQTLRRWEEGIQGEEIAKHVAGRERSATSDSDRPSPVNHFPFPAGEKDKMLLDGVCLLVPEKDGDSPKKLREPCTSKPASLADLAGSRSPSMKDASAVGKEDNGLLQH